jgi:hypothetical protein
LRVTLEDDRDALQHVVEHAARFAGGDHRDDQRGKDARAACQRRAQRITALDLREHLAQRIAETVVTGAFDGHLQRAPHRHAGANQGGEGAEERDPRALRRRPDARTHARTAEHVALDARDEERPAV